MPDQNDPSSIAEPGIPPAGDPAEEFLRQRARLGELAESQYPAGPQNFIPFIRHAFPNPWEQREALVQQLQEPYLKRYSEQVGTQGITPEMAASFGVPLEASQMATHVMEPNPIAVQPELYAQEANPLFRAQAQEDYNRMFPGTIPPYTALPRPEGLPQYLEGAPSPTGVHAQVYPPENRQLNPLQVQALVPYIRASAEGQFRQPTAQSLTNQQQQAYLEQFLPLDTAIKSGKTLTPQQRALHEALGVQLGAFNKIAPPGSIAARTEMQNFAKQKMLMATDIAQELAKLEQIETQILDTRAHTAHYKDLKESGEEQIKILEKRIDLAKDRRELLYIGQLLAEGNFSKDAESQLMGRVADKLGLHMEEASGFFNKVFGKHALTPKKPSPQERLRQLRGQGLPDDQIRAILKKEYGK